MTDWRPWTGGPAPDCPSVKIRLRCQSRDDAEERPAKPPKWWTRWTHDGGPGDIVEIKEIQE